MNRIKAKTFTSDLRRRRRSNEPIYDQIQKPIEEEKEKTEEEKTEEEKEEEHANDEIEEEEKESDYFRLCMKHFDSIMHEEYTKKEEVSEYHERRCTINPLHTNNIATSIELPNILKQKDKNYQVNEYNNKIFVKLEDKEELQKHDRHEISNILRTYACFGQDEDLIMSIAFSKKTNIFATGSVTGDVTIYDLQSKLMLHKFSHSDKKIFSVAFSENGTKLAVGVEEEQEDQAEVLYSYREFQKRFKQHPRSWWCFGNCCGSLCCLGYGPVLMVSAMIVYDKDYDNCCISILATIAKSIKIFVKALINNKYFYDPWNWFELPILILFFYWLLSYRYYHNIRSDLEPDIIQALNGDQMHFIPLHTLAYYTTQAQDLLSMLFILVGLHLLKTMQKLPYGVGPRVMAITKTMGDRNIIPFYLVLSILIGIFAGGAHLAFGNEITQYRFFSSSVETIFFSMYGDFNMPLEEMQNSNVYLAYGFFAAVSILLTLIMMNIFIAVVSNVYERIERTTEIIYEKQLDNFMLDQIPYTLVEQLEIAEEGVPYEIAIDGEDRDWNEIKNEIKRLRIHSENELRNMGRKLETQINEIKSLKTIKLKSDKEFKDLLLKTLRVNNVTTV